MIHLGDCLTVMAGMPAESVDAVVTDPPYGLGFMGKEWDSVRREASVPPSAARRIADGSDVGRLGNYPGGKGQAAVRFDGHPFQAWCEAWGREALRVTKPGGYLLAFGGTRTHHRLVCGLEDAGWIIRDELDWIYASGFPKGRANLKPAHEPIVLARKPGPLRPLAIDECRIDSGTERVPVFDNLGRDSHGIYGDGLQGSKQTGQQANYGRWPSNLLLSDPELFDEPNPYVVGSGAMTQDGVASGRSRGFASDGYVGGSGSNYNGEPQGFGAGGGYSRFFIVPKADRADREPLTRDEALRLHRASGDCDKLQAWESADLSQSDQTDSTSLGRATSEDSTTADSNWATSRLGSEPMGQSPRDTKSTTSTATPPITTSTTSSSLTPLATSESTPVANSETVNGGSHAESADNSSPLTPSIGTSLERAGRSTDAAVRVTSSKLSKRNVCGACGKPLPRVTSHPTVKPTDLMRHLVRLVTPSGGTVLDPFLGSGSTAIACELEGFPWIGVEQSAEYVAIAEARLNGVQRGLGLDVAAPERVPTKTRDSNNLSRDQRRKRNDDRWVNQQWAKSDEEPAA